MFRITKKNKIVAIILLILFLCIGVAVMFFYSYYNKTINGQNNNQIINDKVLFLIKENSNLKLQITDLQNSLVNLKNRFISLENNLSSFENRIVEFENSNPVTSEKNVLMVILVYKIKDLYYKNKNFNDELNNLKDITKNKSNIYSIVSKLDQFTNIGNVRDIFRKEYKTLLTMNKDSKIEKFINQNIQIRKTKNINDSDNVIDKHIKQIDDFIKEEDYESAINIIVNNKYDNYLIKTKEILTKNIEFNNLLDEILNSIYIN